MPERNRSAEELTVNWGEATSWLFSGGVSATVRRLYLSMYVERQVLVAGRMCTPLSLTSK